MGIVTITLIGAAAIFGLGLASARAARNESRLMNAERASKEHRDSIQAESQIKIEASRDNQATDTNKENPDAMKLASGARS